ncbi:MAG: PEFG-CTERM sorting domain-containing protein [Nitrosopumilus sp. B06]|nr:MAG: PEFG-CTERM sorting domain-containing protein [Nitrosopumilus sp. B06]
MFNGFGLPGEEFTGPIGTMTQKQVVPEFGSIAMMILAVSIISIVAITAKSRIVPRI